MVYAALEGLTFTDMLLWGLLGAVSGVLIDVDHALLSMIVKKRYKEGLKWFRKPVEAVSRFLEEMDYDSLVYHRLVSHSAVLAVLFYLSTSYSLFVPVAFGVGVHLMCDIVYDLYCGSYWFQA